MDNLVDVLAPSQNSAYQQNTSKDIPKTVNTFFLTNRIYPKKAEKWISCTTLLQKQLFYCPVLLHSLSSLWQVKDCVQQKKIFYLKSPSIFPSSTRKHQQLNLDYSAVSQEEDGLTMPALKHRCFSYLSTGVMSTVKIVQFKEYSIEFTV